VFEQRVSVRRGFARTSLGQLNFCVAGEGPALVLLHNTWQSSKMYAGVIPAFAQNFRVYAIETIGQGDSDPAPDRDMLMDEYARTLLEAFDSLALDDVNLVGHHTGSVIASETAIQAPNRIRKLVISGMPYWRNPTTRLANVTGAFFADYEIKDDGSHFDSIWQKRAASGYYPLEMSNEAYIDYIKPGPRTSLALRALFRWDSTAKLPQITAPTLVLCSEKDGFVKNIRHVQELVPNSTLQILPGGEAHPLYGQEAFANAVTEFCKD
jgi:pimeloyl-ACP methyl ester carboxylesterase